MTKGEAVVIIGGGISGLAAAYQLQCDGVPFLLLERNDRFGGVIRTDEVEGFVIDGGPDSLLVQKPAAIALCKELGLGDCLVPTLPPRTAYVFRSGQLHPLPDASILGIPTRLTPLASTRLLTAAGKVRMAMDLVTPAAKTTDDESVGSFFRRRFGEESVAYLAEPLLAGIHAGDVERLSMQALFPRLIAAEREYGSIIQAFRSTSTSDNRPKDGIFRSLRGGLGQLTRAILSALPPSSLRVGEPVERLCGRGPYMMQLRSGQSVTARHLILATPAHVTAQLVAPIDPELGSLCASIPYTSTATILLGYPRGSIQHPLDGTGFVVPRVETDLSLMAGSWVSAKWPGRAPAGQALLRGFVGGARDPHALDKTDDELVAAAHGDFRDLLEISVEPTLRRVYRWPRLNPQHEVGHLQKLSAIDQRLEGFPGLQIIGAGFRGVGIPDCVAGGRAAGTTVTKTRES